MWLFTRFDPARPRSVVAWAVLVGILAGILAATYHAIVTEPLIDDAIAIEDARIAAEARAEADGGHAAAEPEQVSRSDQRGPGLFVGTALYGAAYALILAVAAMAMRGAWLDPFRRAVLAGSILAASLTIVPWLKYAPNPPAVGDTATGGERQRYFWLLVGLIGLILAAAANLSSRLRDRGWPDTRRVATLVLATVVVGGVVLAVMPAVNDPIPAEVPANLIWRFRVASLTGNLLLWGGLIMAFGLLWAERSDAAVATGPAVPPGSGEPGSSPQNSMPFRAETPAS